MRANEMNEKLKIRVIEAFIGEDLEQYVEMHLGLDWKKALNGELTPYVRKLIDQSFYFESQRGTRTELQFVQELIYSRCIELKLIDSWFYRITLNGSDKDCLITKISTNASDFWEINTNNYYEVVSNYHGVFVNKENFYITKGKLLNLCESAKHHNQYILAVDVLYKSYCFLPILPNLDDMDYITEHTWGEGFSISLKGREWLQLGEEDYLRGSICGE